MGMSSTTLKQRHHLQGQEAAQYSGKHTHLKRRSSFEGANLFNSYDYIKLVNASKGCKDPKPKAIQCLKTTC